MGVTTEKKTYNATIGRDGEALWATHVPEEGLSSCRTTATGAIDSIRDLIARKTGLKVEDFIVDFTWK